MNGCAFQQISKLSKDLHEVSNGVKAVKTYFLFHSTKTGWLIWILVLFQLGQKSASSLFYWIPYKPPCLHTSYCLKKESQPQSSRVWWWRQDHLHTSTRSLKGFTFQLSTNPRSIHTAAWIWQSHIKISWGSQTAAMPASIRVKWLGLLQYRWKAETKFNFHVPLVLLVGLKKTQWRKA